MSEIPAYLQTTFLIAAGGLVASAVAFVRNQFRDWKAGIEAGAKSAAEVHQLAAMIAGATGLPIAKLNASALIEVFKSLDEEVDVLRAFIRAVPPPYVIWIKEEVEPGEFRMMQVSDYFAELFLGGPASLYFHRADDAVFPPDIAEVYARNDAEVLKQGRPMKFVEPVDAPATGAKGTFESTKFPFTLHGRRRVCGIGIYSAEDISHEA